MKSLLFVSSMVMIVLASARVAGADVIENVNWADDVVAYTSAIQNYGGTSMDADHEFWLLGQPDADANGNGYAWDEGDLDYVAGWKANYPNEFFIVYFDIGLADLEGTDLDIHKYAGSGASADVFVSTDGDDYVWIGALGGGEPGCFQVESFDFAGVWGVHYVKLVRTANGSNTGVFVDALGGVPVPEPATTTLLAIGAGLLALRRPARSRKSRLLA